jgi:hypothetical protein
MRGRVMTLAARYGWARLPMLVAGFSLATILAASAQMPPATDEPEAAASEDAAEPEATEPDAAKDIDKDVDPGELDWSQLNVDASTLPSLTAKAGAAAKKSASTDAAWSSSRKANGSSGVSVKQSISPFWDTRVGADMTVAPQGPLTNSQVLSEKLANGGSLPQSSGSAWAAITAPGVASIWDKTSVEARVDPNAEQSKLGASLSKSLPLGEQYSLTLQNGYNVTQQGIVPVPGIAGHPQRNYQTDQSAKLSVTDTGTSLIAGQTLSTAEDKWLHTIGAEQKLFGGVTISGSIGETAQGTANKSFSAGFKRSW